MRARTWRHTVRLLILSTLAGSGCGDDSAVNPGQDGKPVHAANSATGSDASANGGPTPGSNGPTTDDGGKDSGAGTGDASSNTGSEPPKVFTREACTLLRDAGPQGTLTPRVEIVAEGLEVPWDLAFMPDGDILVTERPGRLRLIRDGKVMPAPILEVKIAKINAVLGSEGGLLGVLLHPDFASNRLFYLYFTARNPDNTPVNRLVRYELGKDGISAELDTVILDNIPAGGHHQGGRMRIGPDGKLYVGVGAYQPELAQIQDELPGKLLRMNLDGSVPNDNPTPGSLVFASGIRNTQGYDWYDAHHLLLMDHGPSGIELNNPTLIGYDEFNVVRAGDNLGWPEVWGCKKRNGINEPVMAWRNSFPPGGAAIYTGTAIPEWTGSFLVATLGFTPASGRHLHRIEFDPENPYVVRRHEVFLRNQYGRLRSVVMGPDGHLYVTTSNCEDRGTCPPQGDVIMRIVGVE